MTAVARRDITSLETYTGARVDLLDPDPETISIEDIAVHLGNICRYGGAVNKYYSVAEHAVRVSRLVPASLALKALHHDSHEAYTNDIVAPMKTVLEQLAPGALKKIQDRLDAAICIAFGVEPPTEDEHLIIKAADDHALFREAAALKYSHGRGEHWGNTHYYKPWADIGWSPKRAQREFLKRHQELISQ